MSVDWKPRLVEMARTHTGPALQRAVNEALAKGATVDDVRAASTQAPQLQALFSDGFEAASKRPLSEQTPTPLIESRVGVPAHVVRAGGVLILPWHKQASLPATPPARLPAPSTQAPTVLGEPTSSAELQDLLRTAA